MKTIEKNKNNLTIEQWFNSDFKVNKLDFKNRSYTREEIEKLYKNYINEKNSK